VPGLKIYLKESKRLATSMTDKSSLCGSINNIHRQGGENEQSAEMAEDPHRRVTEWVRQMETFEFTSYRGNSHTRVESSTLE
jgi:hypothetical protein